MAKEKGSESPAENDAETSEASGKSAKPKVKKSLMGAIGIGGKKKKGAKKSHEPEVTWIIRLEQVWGAALGNLKEILRGLFSPDGPTRRMSLLFLVSAFGLLAVSGMTYQQYRTYKFERKAADAGAKPAEDSKLDDFLKKTREINRSKYTTIEIGSFTQELKPMENDRVIPGVVHLAELELVLECDAKDTCLYVESHLIPARNQVTNMLTPVTREELMSKEGKTKLKKQIMEKLNLWLPRGRIESVYISRLIVS